MRNDFERIAFNRDEIWDLQPFGERRRFLSRFRRDFKSVFFVLAVVQKGPIPIRDVSKFQ